MRPRVPIAPVILGAGLCTVCAARSSIQPDTSVPEPRTASAEPVAAARANPVSSAEPTVSGASMETPAAAEAPDFAGEVMPILMRSCSPCHAPGGRMYERLPFDKAEVVRENRAGIARRLKNPDDKQVLERYWNLQAEGPQVP